MVDINTTLQPLISQIEPLMKTVSVLVGGVFGLYLISLYIRWKEYLLVSRLLKEIRRDIKAIAAKQGVKLEESDGQKIKNALRLLKQKLFGKK